MKKLVCEIHGLSNHTETKNGNVKPRYRCLKYGAKRVSENIEIKREKAYEKYGNSCKVCGYDRCRNSLEFHHINPEDKEITPSKVFSRSWDKIQKELDKCILLCANCHREVHAGLIEIPIE